MGSEKIHMVDLISQYQNIKEEIDQAIINVCSTAQFIKGPEVKTFEASLAKYLGVKHVIGCANGTDSLQIALMALGLEPGDEVIVPAFTYVATAEVIGLLRLKPVMIDVDPNTFNINEDLVRAALTEKTKAIIPVHLFGQTTDMAPIVALAKEKEIYIIEDNAQAIGSNYNNGEGGTQKSGTIGDIGSTSFFPSKNLGCYGDGGALFTNSDDLAEKMRMIANHGQKKRYYHSVIGCNSRLDSIQAAVLNIKLKHLDTYSARRNEVADKYDQAFEEIDSIQTPVREENSNHVFHQYTLRIKNGQRDQLREFLTDKGIPTGIYYPVPLYKQEAFSQYVESGFALENTEMLCKEVLSLPIHTEMKSEVQDFIISSVKQFTN